MPTYYVDDGGDNTNGSSWATAYTSINALDTAVALASGDIVYFGHDMNCQAVNSANLTITGPASGLPVYFVSATTGSSPATYQKGTGAQIDTTEGAFQITFDGSFALYGLRITHGSTLNTSPDDNEYFYAEDCIFRPANNRQVSVRGVFVRCDFDFASDTGTSSTTCLNLNNGASLEWYDCRVLNASNRNVGLLQGASGLGTYGTFRMVGGSLSGMTNVSAAAVYNTGGMIEFLNVDMPVSLTRISSGMPAVTGSEVRFINCGTSDDKTQLLLGGQTGRLQSSSSITRAGGAQIEGAGCSWLITTTSACGFGSPFYSEWIGGLIGSTGSKTFDVFIANDTAAFNDDEVWLEVQYKADSGAGKWTTVSNRKASFTAAAAAHTTDSSSWSGSGPSFTHKQRLRVTATVNATGQYRARIAVGLASIAAGRNFYIDPKVVVS